MLSLFLLVIIILVIFITTRRDKSLVLLFNQLRCDATEWPVVGHTYKFFGSSESIMNVFQKMGKETTSKGGIMGIWHFNKLFLMVTDADAIEYIQKHCLEKGLISKVGRIVLGNSSIIAPVPIWRPRRKLNTLAFSHKKLVGFVEIFSKQSFVLVEKLKEVADKESVSMWDYIPLYAMDAICETTMGVKMNAQYNPSNPFIIATNKLFVLAIERFQKPWLYFDCVYKMLKPKYMEYENLIYNFIEKVIEEIRKSAVVQAKDKQVKELDNVKDIIKLTEIKTEMSNSILSIMINSSDEEQELTNVALQEEAMLFIGAGTDTSSVGIAFTIVMLSRYPHVQEKVYQELQEVFGDSDRPVVAEDLFRLRYLEAVIKETLRLYPPVPIILRELHSDMTLPSGITLIKGCNILINFMALHRNPLYWGHDAEEFRPERFIEAPLKHPVAYMPFGCGPRACIAYQYAYMSMKTTIANILRHFRLSPAPNPVTGQLPQKDEPLKLKYELMLRHADNYMIRLHKRF